MFVDTNSGRVIPSFSMRPVQDLQVLNKDVIPTYGCLIFVPKMDNTDPQKTLASFGSLMLLETVSFSELLNGAS